MNREIKFRAWFQIDEGEKSFTAMIPNVCVYASGTLGASSDDFSEAILPWRFDPYDERFINGEDSIDFGNANVSEHEEGWVLFDGIPMQFTGLRDRNGVEIYEGDIVKTPGVEPSDDLIGVIEYVEMSAMFVQRIKIIELYLTNKGHRMQVIGNIYMRIPH